ncbi:enoyl-[acyl-carrier-protein] reductase [Neorickettsia helminthoeca str. Oregon]|uniref:Enoyl-[acyl-carrier-protein] reductase [NADH] n=1 Tax=Neorickettsia helminthoeca str. Oregon TaxID=1286528 RepID=X5HL13_9RICK|nr:SDR family oxidoreductase [Neorickettsia helminthoeca]AHX11020.1 enoyl-[acyl-carrier-protein] reductase [Neorickettsia helminthoeca str. Oregon]
MLEGKLGLILGIANDRSIAYSIGKICNENGANLILTYPVDQFKKRLVPIAEEFGGAELVCCDVSKEEGIAGLFHIIAEKYGKLDFIVHSVAFSDKEELQGEYINTSLANFLNSMHISCYSLTAICRYALPLMKENGGSVLTLSYYGAEKVIPHYNVMGVCKAALEASVKYLSVDLGKYSIRINTISAGPIKTLAASAIGKFSYILKWSKHNSPIKRNTTKEDVAGAALYFLSDLSSGTTGSTLHVDCGYHVVGMRAVDLPEDIMDV